MSRHLPPVLLLFLALQTGCGGRRAEAPSTSLRSSRNFLTPAELRTTGSPNVYHAVSMLRSSWLHPRGPDSFHNQGGVWVYIDDVREGGVDVLHSVAIAHISYIQYFDGNAASARWGLDHGHGVIFISTRPRDARVRLEG